MLSDANASLSADTRDNTLRHVTGPVTTDNATNDNGRRLVDLCRAEHLTIADTYFPRKLIHQYTWYSPDGRTKKALDHISTNF